MNPFSVLKKEHEQIEMELIELEAVMEVEEINYPNLVHSFKRLCGLWNIHEKKEEKIFQVMEKENLRVPVQTMTCEHEDLKIHRQRIKDAINSGDESRVRGSFEEDLKLMIKKIRDHISKEDEIFYTTILSEFTREELEDMKKVLS
jgi:DUF438 domain-containing protein